MDLGLSDKSAVVLASSTGLGFAVAEALAQEGARVAISGRDGNRLQGAIDRLEAAHPGRAFGESCDVTDGAALVRHLESSRERMGSLDILVANAGGPPPGTASQVTDETLDQAYELTMKASIRAIATVLPWMREKKWGRIIALTSMSVREPIPTLALSNIMRAGLTGYLKTLAAEVAADGVLVNSVCTGLFLTDRLASLGRARAEQAGRTMEQEMRAMEELIPVGRIGDPKEFGALVAFLASEQASFLTGVAIPIHGGMAKSLL